MAKLVLNDITNLEGNPSSAQTNINANSAAIETALENTLSRDGTTPNTMSADIDINSNRLLNVPPPVNDTDIVRLGDIGTSTSSTTATLTSVLDTAGRYTATNLEGVLSEIATLIELASTSTDDGTEGYHLVSFPPLTGELGVENYEYTYSNALRFIPSSLHAGIVDGTNTTALTTYIQAFLDAGELNVLAVRDSHFPSGTYLTDTLYIPLGMWVHGDGHIETTARQATLFQQTSTGSGNDIFKFKSLQNGSLYYWYGKLNNFSIFGDSSNTTGFGIHTKDESANDVNFQDTTEIRDITVRKFPAGGIRVTTGAFPLELNSLKLLFNNGPGIWLTRTTVYQGVRLNNISGDGNNGGVIKLEDFDEDSSVAITNLKSEARVNADYSSAEHQTIAIDLDNCGGLPLVINGASHSSSIPDGGNYKKPGALVNISAGGYPNLTWSGVSIRVRGSDTGTDPTIIDGTTLTEPLYTTAHGVFGGTFQFFGSTLQQQRIQNTDADTTPSVAECNIILLVNSGATTITDFDDAVDGQLLIVTFNDANSTISDNANIALAGGMTGSANDTLTLISVAGVWREVSRSVN